MNQTGNQIDNQQTRSRMCTRTNQAPGLRDPGIDNLSTKNTITEKPALGLLSDSQKNVKYKIWK